MEFVLAQGTVQVEPPAGFEEYVDLALAYTALDEANAHRYFGPGPHWRFLEDGGLAEQSMLERIRVISQCETPEDTMRSLIPKGTNRSKLPPGNMRQALDSLHALIEEKGGVDGIFGYSEGASVSAALLLDDRDRSLSKCIPRQLKFAVFFTGWPPLSPDGTILLADETDEIIDVPSIHVIGASDPYLQGAMALYNVCDESTSMLFDHAHGHVLPRSPQTLRELAGSISDTMTSVQVY